MLAAPPLKADALAAWFAEAVRAELAELEQTGSDQRYELLSGQHLKSLYPIYRFMLADKARVPEDASGMIEVEGRRFNATVVAQEGGRIDVQIDGAAELLEYITRAILHIDDLSLMRKLAELLEAISAGTEPASRFSTEIFHPKSSGASRVSLPDVPTLNRLTGEQRDVLERACASEVTFVWGPPGTGKTYVIAHLTAALIERGERVLLTSHTNAAINQSIYEAVKKASGMGGNAGPLAGTELERSSKIVRIGRVNDEKVPKTVRLDDIVECRAHGIQSEIIDFESKILQLSERRALMNLQLAEWGRLRDLGQSLAETEKHMRDAAVLAERAMAEHALARCRVGQRTAEVENAGRAWFFRRRKVERARQALAVDERAYAVASEIVDEAAVSNRSAEAAVAAACRQMEVQAERCARWPAPEGLLAEQAASIDADLAQIERRVTELKARLDALKNEVIASASVVAATLTKCYVGNELDGQSFDAVIVDEISMALPPLLFIAARRALKRVILVGDFKQLPPIVRSDCEVSSERLGRDTFHLAGIARDFEDAHHPALTYLRTQRRMLPPIADAARYISYGPDDLKDHRCVFEREPPNWLAFLPANALVAVDTADLHCWSGRQAGSLSRFNLYSAQIATELAAMAAKAAPHPGPSDPKRIGIVTPYTAQRRLLTRLVQGLKLEDWVLVGTIHTFQGGEADLIIFDTVLGEPYWTARLCTPSQLSEVKRDLNVAITRSRSKFVLVGSSEWLNRHAKVTSGLGQLWQYMKDHAALVSAYELVQAGFARRVAEDDVGAYQVPTDGDSPVRELLDENTFFERFAADLRQASESVLGLVPFFGDYRWPKVEPLLRAALERGVEVTLITPPAVEAMNPSYVGTAIRSLRQLGAVVIAATGIHGKDIVIDSRIHYTGSLNWASHRGREEIMHRTVSPEYARMVLEYLQARHIRSAAQQGGQPRTCPICHGPTQIVNQRRMKPWDKKPIKLGCAHEQQPDCNYLVDIDQRSPFVDIPQCKIDHQTRYRRVRRGRGESWECPKHPRECNRFKVILGDP